MTAPEIVAYISSRGHSVWLNVRPDGDRIAITPPPDDRIRDRIIANRDRILDYLRALHAPAATAHLIVAWSGATRDSVRARGVCLSCGIPWEMHGSPPLDAWTIVDDPNDAVLVEAAAIIVVETAAAAARGAKYATPTPAHVQTGDDVQ